MKVLFLLTLLTACSSTPPWETDPSWLGVQTFELDAHPELSEMSVKKETLQTGDQVRYYKKLAPHRSKANCLSLGGCAGLPVEKDCHFHFTLNGGKVIEYKHTPGCVLTRLSPRP